MGTFRLVRTGPRPSAQMVDFDPSSTRSACLPPAPRTSRASNGIDGLYMGVPVKLGLGRIEQIYEGRPRRRTPSRQR